MRSVLVAEFAGAFAEDKDQARRVREEVLRPALESGEDVTVDFDGVALATQSFVHALISDLVRNEELDALDRILFINCDADVRTIISIVVEYSQDDGDPSSGVDRAGLSD